MTQKEMWQNSPQRVCFQHGRHTDEGCLELHEMRAKKLY